MGTTAAISAGALGVQAIGTIGNAYSESQALKAQGAYQQGVYNVNARMAEFQATDSIERGEFEASEIIRKSSRSIAAVRKMGKQVKGAQKVALAAQGIETTSGSAADVMAETDYLSKGDEIDLKYAAEMDALTVKNNAWREAWGFKAQSNEYLNRGRIVERAANTAARNTLLTGGINAVGYALDAYGQYKKGGGSLSFGKSKVKTKTVSNFDSPSSRNV